MTEKVNTSSLLDLMNDLKEEISSKDEILRRKIATLVQMSKMISNNIQCLVEKNDAIESDFFDMKTRQEYCFKVLKDLEKEQNEMEDLMEQKCLFFRKVSTGFLNSVEKKVEFMRQDIENKTIRSQSEPITCISCSKMFPSQKDLEQHRIQKHLCSTNCKE